VLIAGIGNIFLSDDGFGVEVAQQLTRRQLPAGVKVIDFGIRGLDLVYALLDGYDATILIDTVQRDGAPGTLYLIEPELEDPAGTSGEELLISPHDMHPQRVLQLVRALGGDCRRLLLLGCEPASLEQAMGLSNAVQLAVSEAVERIELLVQQPLTGELL
jgi:hydrogenase maturation protease